VCSDPENNPCGAGTECLPSNYTPPDYCDDAGFVCTDQNVANCGAGTTCLPDFYKPPDTCTNDEYYCCNPENDNCGLASECLPSTYDPPNKCYGNSVCADPNALACKIGTVCQVPFLIARGSVGRWGDGPERLSNRHECWNDN
jgi:hypothetical protein